MTIRVITRGDRPRMKRTSEAALNVNLDHGRYEITFIVEDIALLPPTRNGDTLVITMENNGFEVRRIFVDGESLVDILYYEV